MKKHTKKLPLLLALSCLLVMTACQTALPPTPPLGNSSESTSSDSSQNSSQNSSSDNSQDSSEDNSEDSSEDSSEGSSEDNSQDSSEDSSQGSANEPSPPTQPDPPVDPEPPAPIPTAKYIQCTGSSVNIRAGAGTGYSILGQAEKGTMYAVTKKIGNWYEIAYRNKTAYLHADYAYEFTLEMTNSKKTEEVIQEGYKLLGTPYVYGAVRLHNGKGKLLSNFSVQKMDCSSLIQYIFYQGASVLLDVTTRTQVVQGKYVHPNDLRRGDCIYFTNESREHKTGIERVGHVALYVGDNYILHTASDYARIEKMSAKRWSYYIEARRFL